jgi:hypothetical protein
MTRRVDVCGQRSARTPFPRKRVKAGGDCCAAAFPLRRASTNQTSGHINPAADRMSRLAQHYARLGLTPGASHAEIAAAFRAHALRQHPDCGGSASTFAALHAARDALLSAPPGAGELGSLRMYRHGGSAERASDKWALLGAVILPTAVGMAVGLRLLYVDAGNAAEGRGVRAGGNSRVRLSDLRRMGSGEGAERVTAVNELVGGSEPVVVGEGGATPAAAAAVRVDPAPAPERPRERSS